MLSCLVSIDSKSKLRPISLRNGGVAEGLQGIGRQGGARDQGERHGRVAAHRAEAEHLLRLVGARVLKMLSAERRRAGLDDVGFFD